MILPFVESSVYEMGPEMLSSVITQIRNAVVTHCQLSLPTGV